MIKIETLFTSTLFLLVALAIGLGVGAVGQRAAAAPADAPIVLAAKSIPPNCLMDPITHKLVCTPFQGGRRMA